MDVISMHQAGFTNAVASLGTALTSQQCSLLKRFTNEVLVIYDSDGAGVKAALRAIPLLKDAGLATKVINLSPYKDPDEFIKTEGAEAFEERLENGMNGFMFEIDKLRLNYDINDPQGKTDFFHEIARKLCRFSDEMERSNYLEAVCRQYRIDPQILKKQVNQLALKGVGLTPRTEDAQPVKQKNKMKVSGSDMPQRLLLTWLTNYPKIYEEVSKIIKIEDFTDPLYRHIAELLFAQFEQGKNNPASILDAFPEVEEQKEVAAVLHAQIKLDNQEERQKALSEVIIHMKKESIQKRTSELKKEDSAGLMALIKEKMELEELRTKKQKLHISFE